MSDRYDLLLLKARSEMIGKTILRKGVDSDTVFNSVWDDVIKGPRGFKQGVNETLNAPQGGPSTWWKHRPQGGPRAWWQRYKDIKALSPEGRKGLHELQAQHEKENVVTPQKFADKHGDLIRDVQAPKPTPNVKAMATDMAKPRDNSRLTDMAQSVQATPPSLPTGGKTVAEQLGGRSNKLSEELDRERSGVSVKETKATPPTQKRTIMDRLLSREPPVTTTGDRPPVGHGSAKAESEWREKQRDLVNAEVDKLPPPAPAGELPDVPDYLPHSEASTIHTSPPPAKEEPQGADKEKITNWLGKDFELSADDDVSLLPFGLIKDTKPPQEGASDYSLLPGGWAEGGVS